MHKYDLESNKYILILIGLCIVFVLIIWHAFSYLPQKDEIQIYKEIIPIEAQQAEITEEEESEEGFLEEDDEETSIEEEPDEEQEPEEEQEVLLEEKTEKNIAPLESISEEEILGNVQKPIPIKKENPYEATIIKAQEYKAKKDFIKAVTEYEKALNLTKDIKQQADCYEEIAVLYALMRRHGTALSYAQKSFNMKPTTEREVLLARLYYKTGSVEKAFERAKNIMNRDFSNDLDGQ